MACNPSTLLASGKAFQGLSDEGLRLSIIASLKSLVVGISPGKDVTPGAVLLRGKAFQSLDDQSLRNCIFRSACIIGGG